MRSIIKQMSVILIILLAGATVHSELLLMENFEGRTNGNADNLTLNGVLGGFLDSDSNNTGNVVIETNDGSQTIRFMTTTSGDDRGFIMTGVNNPINDGESGVLFFRFRLRSDSGQAYGWYGITDINMISAGDDACNDAANNSSDTVVAGFIVASGSGGESDLEMRTIDTGTEVFAMTEGQWYDCWIVADNAADTFDVYIRPVSGPGGPVPTEAPSEDDKVIDGYPFNADNDLPLRGFAASHPDDRPTSGQTKRFHGDDFYWDGDQGLVSLKASKPVPAHGEGLVAIDQVLSWQAPTSPEVYDVIGYDVYMDPNMVKVTNRDPAVLKSAGQTTTSYDPTPDMAFVKTYYWVVDTTVTLVSDPNDPKTPVVQAGKVWSFTTTNPGPKITGDPVDVLVSAGDEASFTANVSSPYVQASIQWYTSEDPTNDTPADDLAISGATGLTYVIEHVGLADEKYYYCAASNSYENVNYEVTSNTAALGIKRKVAHWTLDEADYVGGQYLDSSGEGHHADPNGTVVFVDGQNPALTNECVAVSALSGWANAGTWDPSQYSGQLTVSVWVKWDGQPASPVYQGLLGKRSVYASDMRWQIEVQNNTASALRFGSNQGTTIVSPALPVGEWEQVVCTFDGSTATIYRNGTYAARGAFTLGTGPTANLMIGAVGQDPALAVPTSIFSGCLDDIRIYNYAQDALTVAYGFTDFDGQNRSACLDPEDPILIAYDMDGDCEVGLSDLMELAAHWLDGQLVPDTVARP